MLVGDLVRITRPSIGVPVGTIGLIMRVSMWRTDEERQKTRGLSQVPLYFVQRMNGPLRRYLARDLETVSASR